MKRLFKKIAPFVGVVASLAIPALAPSLAPLLFGSQTLTGAVLGAASSGLTTALAGGKFRDVLTNAAIGFAGGYLSAGGLQELTSYAGQALGLTTPAAAAGAGAAAPVAGLTGESLPALAQGGQYGSITSPTFPTTGFTEAVAGAVPGTAGTTGTTAALTASNIAQGLSIGGDAAMKALTQLAGIAFGTTDTAALTAAQQQYLKALEVQAQQDRRVFEEKLQIALNLKQMGEPNFEKAWADSQIRLERQAQEAERTLQTRGASAATIDAARRQRETQAALAGSKSVATEGERAFAAMKSAASAFPTYPSAASGPEAERLKQARDAQQRRNTAIEQGFKALGGMFGSGDKTTTGGQRKAGVSVPGTVVTTTTQPSYAPTTSPFDADAIFDNFSLYGS